MNKKIIKPLIDRALVGDTDAFDSIVNICDVSVRPYVVGLCGNMFDSNDILQETYIKAYLNLSKYNSNYPMDVWLKRIARNTFIDLKRKEKSLIASSLTDNDRERGNSDDSPEELIITAERIKNAELKLSLLPQAYRKIIELRYFNSMNYNEISEVLCLPLGTVKTHLFRARKLLTEMIKNLDTK
ncbi:MAG: RNA polymerase sigma factor [Rikenellaceae bacterium]